jgi:hypothetical protein
MVGNTFHFYTFILKSYFEIIENFFLSLKTQKVSSPLCLVLAVFSVISLVLSTDEIGHQQASVPDGNATAEDDHGWYAPVAVILTPISKDKVENKQTNTFRPRISGYGAPSHWRNRNPWHHPALPPWWYPYGNFGIHGNIHV